MPIVQSKFPTPLTNTVRGALKPRPLLAEIVFLSLIILSAIATAPVAFTVTKQNS